MDKYETINKIKEYVDNASMSTKDKASMIIALLNNNIAIVDGVVSICKVEPNLAMAFNALESLDMMSKEINKDMHKFMSKIKDNPYFEHTKNMIGYRQVLDAATIVMIDFIQQYDPENYTVMDYKLIMTNFFKSTTFPNFDRMYFMIKGFSSYEEKRFTVGEARDFRDKIVGKIKSLCKYAGCDNLDDIEVSDTVTTMNILNKVLTLCTLYLKSHD